MLTRESLVRTKTRALRRRVWFKTTSRLERGIIDLTIRCVERIRSSVLAGVLSEIVAKISGIVEKSFTSQTEKIGAKIVERVCELALSWGNSTAFNWKHDLNFVRYLGVNAINARGTRI